METSAQYAARTMEDGLLGEKTLISRNQSQDPGRDGWEEQVVRECEDDYYGPVITTYQTSAAYAETLPLEGLPDWDLSPLCRKMTPEEDAQILVQGRRPESGKLVWAKAHLGYALPRKQTNRQEPSGWEIPAGGLFCADKGKSRIQRR